MSLTQMQDIAGCRIVVESIQQAYALKQKYEKLAKRFPDRGPQLIDKWTKDYILRPKQDGYRSIHLVMKHRSSGTKYADYNGLRVEIQIRSRLQHAWATAVETASAVTNQMLKSGQGEEDWKRFFQLMGDVIAGREEGPLLAAVEPARLRETADLAVKLRVIPLLEGMSTVMEEGTSGEGVDIYLLVSDSKAREIRYWGFSNSEFQEAVGAYSREEKEAENNPDVNVVLVRVASIKELKEAYPSYFLDSANFVEQVRQLLLTA